MGEPAAARFHDPVAHSHALGGFIAGAIVGIAGAFAAAVAISAVVGAVALEVGTAGLATPLIVGVAATAVEFGATAYVGSKITEFAEHTGESLGGQSMGAASGMIAQGSPDVQVNALPAARAGDAETCDAGVVAQGSESVLVNGQPFARVGDKTSCGGAILSGSPNVFVGGATKTTVPIQSEVPEWVRWAAVIAGILPALGQAARAIGPALAEVEATGLGRAMQTGVKALGRAMEKRGGGAAGRAAYDRAQITRLSNAGKISEARAILQPHVDAGNTSAIIDRLDVSSPRDGGYLWSGNKTAAGDYAASRGGTTLEQTPGGRVIDNWDDLNTKLPWDKGGEDLWGGASQKYAQGMSGDVVAVQTASKAGGGYVFKNYELPEIRRGLATGRITSFEEKVVLPESGVGP